MTNLEKDQIMDLREKGYGYTKIANKMGISVNTIKSFCRRSKEVKPKEDNKHYCKCCGKVVKQTKGRKEKKFCSRECRQKWWNSHLDKVNRKAYEKKICLKCGKEFLVYGSAPKKFCTHSCYIAFRFGGGAD